MSDEHKAKCGRCKIEKPMSSHNYWYMQHTVPIYLCDDCRMAQAKKEILRTLATWVPHLFDIDELSQ
jgi:hypothetical protein